MKNISLKEMLAECGLSKNALSSMISGGSTPKSENLAKIADCLGVSVDYLLGRTDSPDSYSTTPVSEKISNDSDDTPQQVATAFQKLDFSGKLKVMQLIQELTEQQKKAV